MSEDLDSLWKKASPTSYAGATPALSNQMDATNAAGGIVDVKVGPDGKGIENLDALWNASSPTKAPPAPEKKTDWLRAAALTGRAAVQGVSSLPLMVSDILGGGHLRRSLGIREPSSIDQVKSALDYLGAYSPATPKERIGSDVVEGATGALLGGPAKQILGTAAAGGVGGLASGATREAGGGIAAQIAAGLFGNIGTAASIGATKAAARGVGRVLDRSLLPGGDSRGAATVANTAAGSDKDAIIAALRTGQSPVPGLPLDAGQLATRTGNAEFPSLIDLVKRQFGTQTVALADKQKDAAREYLQRLSLSNNPNARKEIIDELSTRLNPELQKAYNQANLAGTLGQELKADAANFGSAAASKVQDVRRMTAAADRAENMGTEFGRRSPATALGAPTGMPSAGKQYSYGQELADRANVVAAQAAPESLALGGASRVAQSRVDNITQAGYYPLSGENLAGRVESYLTKKGDMASDAVRETMKPLGAKLREFSDNNGVIDAQNLHTIRKEIGDSIASNALAKGWDKRRVASLEISVKNAIDDAMEAAGAGGWKGWLEDYKQGMKSANNVTIGREIEKVYLNEAAGKDRSAALIKAVDNATQSPDMLTKRGMARYGNIDQAMTGSGKEIKDNILSQAALDARNQYLSIMGQQNAQKAIGAAYDPIKTPGVLNRTMMMLNFATRQLEGKGGDRSVKKLMDMALNNPSELALAMEKMTPVQKASFFDITRRAAASQAGLLGQ